MAAGRQRAKTNGTGEVQRVQRPSHGALQAKAWVLFEVSWRRVQVGNDPILCLDLQEKHDPPQLLPPSLLNTGVPVRLQMLVFR